MIFWEVVSWHFGWWCWFGDYFIFFLCIVKTNPRRRCIL